MPPVLNAAARSLAVLDMGLLRIELRSQGPEPCILPLDHSPKFPKTYLFRREIKRSSPLQKHFASNPYKRT